MIEVVRVIYINFDEDDPELSNLRATTVKRMWRISPDDLVAYGESERNKKYLDLWFQTGDQMYIESTLEDFDNIIASEITVEFELEEEKINPPDEKK